MTEDAVPSGKTLYTILGVSRTETPRRIRAAYHDRARQLHPDVAGPDATRAFQELNQAYYVLSDPGRRHAYNAALEAAPSDHQTISILAHPERLHPSFEEVYARFLRNFTGLHVTKALDVEVLISRDEASAGCNVPVGVPARSGMIECERTVHVRVPPMTRSGTVYDVAVGGLGVHNFHVRLHVFVEP